MENAPEKRERPTSVVTGSQGDPAATLLAKILSYEFDPILSASTSSESDVPPPPPEPITIELGKDFTYTPIQSGILTSLPPKE
jgi:hypothetical protein